MTAAVIAAAVLLGGGLLFLIFDAIRERRDLAKHLDKVAQRKEAYERFRQKKRNSQEVTKKKER